MGLGCGRGVAGGNQQQVWLAGSRRPTAHTPCTAHARTHLQGYSPAKNDFLFERRLSDYVFGVVAEYSKGRPALVFCRRACACAHGRACRRGKDTHLRLARAPRGRRAPRYGVCEACT